jgi:hypothetical protein
MAYTYQFSRGGVPVHKHSKDDDPAVIGGELDKIAAAHDGRLQAADVVEAANPAGHPLHRHFEWRNNVAAQMWRQEQARSLIRSIEVVMDDNGGEERTAPAYVSVVDSGRSYRAIREVLTSSKLQLSMLVQAERDLRNWQNRYRELTDICEVVREARGRLAERIAKQQQNEHESRPTA